MSEQFKAKSDEITAAVRAGATIEDAARHEDVPIATVRRWLRDGRKGTQRYASFAAAVDGARGDRKAAERALDGRLSAEESERLLAKAARVFGDGDGR